MLSGAEEALPRTTGPKLVARLLVRDAMQVGDPARLPSRTFQHGEITQDGVPYCPQGLTIRPRGIHSPPTKRGTATRSPSPFQAIRDDGDDQSR